MSPRLLPFRRCTRALGALGLAVLAAAPLRAVAGQDPAAEVARLLEAPHEAERDADSLARELAAVGPDAARPLLEALAGGGTRGTALRGLRRAAALGALELLPRTLVLEAVRRNARAEATGQERVAALETLAGVAETSEIGLLLRLASPSESSDGLRHEMASAFEDALARLLEREPRALDVLAAQVREVPPQLLLPLIRQMERCHAPDQLEILARQLGRAPGADVLLLGAIESRARAASLGAAQRARAPVRALLDPTDPLVCIAACRAARALEDAQAVDALIRLLSAPEQAVRTAALSTLESLSKQALGPDPQDWARWYEAELAWWRGDGQRNLSALRLGVRRETAPALMGLARGYLFREEIVPVLTPYLRDEDPDVARLTASVLASLGSRAALPALAAALSETEPAVAAGARKALVRIAGRDLGPEPGPWLELHR